MNIFDKVLQFKGQWRVYQDRVLRNSRQYLDDKKIHIVAAPGSGKTTLGIELIRRIGQPCLILSPSITIRQQWISRIADAFLKDGLKTEDYLSNTLLNPSYITTITYQALHSCTQKYKGTLVEEENDSETVEEAVDFSSFDLYQTIKDAGIKTLCLDEAHHLRNEWWKALEELVANVEDFTIISLTATPPYDSNPTEWERYTKLCGTIDEEITAPELVKEKSLCPHQDYIYFNYPTKEELEVVNHFKQTAKEFADELKKDTLFQSKVNCNLATLSLSSMEKLLQGFLYEDRDSYPDCEELREHLIEQMKARSLIQRNKVCLVANEAINKLLVNSKGKLNSIVKIVEAEHNCIGTNLRLLILCDYIKKEFVSSIGKEEKNVNEIAVVPIFEMLRRKYPSDLKLGALSGGIVIIPADAISFMEQLLEEKGLKANFSELNETGYVKVNMVGNNHAMAQIVTEVFNQGYIQVLIGTKSLLGEGWDSPCINSLILSSFVGSFMLSNQMRGRAIRSMKGNPEKTSNIWHLVCVDDSEESSDFTTMERRFEGFMGVHYTENRIENGLERLDNIKSPFTEKSVEEMNESMLSMAANREGLRDRWQTCLEAIPKMEIADATEVPDKLLTPIKIYHIFNISNPQKRLKKIGKAMLKTLKTLGYITSYAASIKVTKGSSPATSIYLKNATTREKEIFASCIFEFFGMVDNQRYLLVGSTFSKTIHKYYCVPELFGKKKESAMLFCRNICKYLGKYDLVFTKNPEGRQIALKARMHSFEHKGNMKIQKRKKLW